MTPALCLAADAAGFLVGVAVGWLVGLASVALERLYGSGLS